jgi:tetratricopeptide (TPR) repeat protein
MTEKTAAAGDGDESLAHLRRAHEASPANLGIARLLVDALEAADQTKEALAVLERCAKETPGNPELMVELGYAQLAAGDAAAARKAFERALSMRPRDALIRQPLAQIYEVAGEPALAAETLAGVPLESASPRILGDLALLYLRLEQHAQAAEVFRALAEVDPEHVVVARHGLLWCEIRSGDWRGALEVALDTIRLDRFDLTTDFLAYAKDRLFSRVPDAGRREAELRERLYGELMEHADLHGDDDAPGTREEGAAGV